MCSGPQAVLLVIRLNWLFQSRGLIYLFFWWRCCPSGAAPNTTADVFAGVVDSMGLKVVKQQPVQNENGSLRAPYKDAFNPK